MGDTPDSPAPTSPAGSGGKKNAGQKAAPQQSPGALLAAGRAALELTVDEVGDALNLASQTVRLLEADDFEALPAAAFTQGYIRNYAKHVGLDADVVVSAYQDKAGKPAVAWESPRTAAGVAEIVQRHPGVLITAVVAAVVLLIVVILAIVWPDDDVDTLVPDQPGIEQEADPLPGVLGESGSGSSNRTNSAAAVERPLPAAAPDRTSGSRVVGSGRFDAPAASGDGQSSGGFDRDAIDPNDPLAHLPLAKTYPVSSGSSADGSASAAANNAGGAPSPDVDASTSVDENYGLTVNRRLTPEGDDRVRVDVTEDCWVAISSAEGKSLFGVLARPGQTLNLTGAGPFRVKLGYTPGVELFFNDDRVLLEPYTRNDVASLVIGQ